jgi:DNA recombination protein RmuC
VKAKLDQASKQIEQTGVRTRAIERSLRDVESLPGESEASAALEAPAPAPLP